MEKLIAQLQDETKKKGGSIDLSNSEPYLANEDGQYTTYFYERLYCENNTLFVSFVMYDSNADGEYDEYDSQKDFCEIDELSSSELREIIKRVNGVA